MGTTTFYEVRAVGYAWMPNASIAMGPFTIPSDALPEYKRASDETDREYTARMVECAAESRYLGDFSHVTGMEITRISTKTRVLTSGDIITRRHITVLQPFTDECDELWLTAMGDD